MYAVSHLLRDEIETHGHATFHLDLLPDHSPDAYSAGGAPPARLAFTVQPPQKPPGLDGIKAGVLYEHLEKTG